MSSEIRLDSGTIAAVYLGLALFGVGYNALVEWLERKGYTEGFLSLIVALGVAITLIGVAVLSVQAAILTLLAFTASGTPMIAGSILRYLRAREEARKQMIIETKRLEEICKNDQSARMAE